MLVSRHFGSALNPFRGAKFDGSTLIYIEQIYCINGFFPFLVDVCPEVPSTFLAINIPKHRDYGRAQLPLLLGLRGLLEFVRLPGGSRISCPGKVVPGAIAVICRQELFLYSRGLGLARQTGWTWTGESGG